MVDMSQNKTLIAYATSGGTTEEYAKAIGSVLIDEFKMEIDLVDLKKDPNPDLTLYQNIIIGTGINKFIMYQEGVNFLETTDLVNKKAVIYISSLMPKDEVIKRYINPIIQKNVKLKPLDIEVFGGRMRILGRTIQDKTDIEKTKEWTRRIAEKLSV